MRTRPSAFAIKAPVADPGAAEFRFEECKTMYGGRTVTIGDTVFIFARESAAGDGLVALAIVTATNPTARALGVARQTPRVSLTLRRMASAPGPLRRADVQSFTDWPDGAPQTELNFKFYREMTDKLVGITAETATFLRTYF